MGTIWTLIIFLSTFLLTSCSSVQTKRAVASDEVSETWNLISEEKFSFLKTLVRAQGIANDNLGNIFFSSNHSLLKTNISDLSKSSKLDLFPYGGPLRKNDQKELKNLGINHVGDIDYFDNKIVASMEDGGKYQNPVIAFFEAANLKFIGFVKLPHDLQPDGVPWTCAVPEKNVILSSRYDNVTEFNVYDLNSVNLKDHSIKITETIKLPKKIDGIQGVKYFNGSFYISSNSKTLNGYAVLKFNVETNQINQVALMPEEVTEIEGLTFVKDQMLVVGIIGTKLKRRVKVYKFQM